MSDAVYVGIDLGGTTTSAALAHADGTILKEAEIATNGNQGPEDVLRRIGEMVVELSEHANGQLEGAGVGVPGLLDVNTGVVKFLPNLATHWTDVPAADILSQQIDCPVQLLNDVRTATLGELTYGLGRDVQNMVFFALGTGVGGGVVIDGKLRLGPRGAAGELGHQTVDPSGPLCGCGNHGCLEVFASGTALTAEGIRLMKIGQAPKLHELTDGDEANVSVKLIAKAAHQGDAAAKEAIKRAAEYLGIGIANVIVTLHPELIVIGGGVSNIGEMLFKRVRKTLRQRIHMFPPDEIRIEKSSLGDNAGLLGAVALAAGKLDAT